MTFTKKTNGAYARPHPSQLSMAKAKRSRDSQRPSKTGIVLDASELVLSTLTNAARLTPVPYLQDAAVVALNIVTVIQGVQSNKSGFLRLANDACALVYIILCRGKEAVAPVATVTPAYLDHARDLADTLHEIYSYTKLQSSRNKLIRMIQYKSDAGIIQEYRDRLKQSLDVFTLKSTMSIQDTLAEIKEQVSNMADQTKDLHEREVRRQESLEMEAQAREAKQAHLEREKASEKAKLELELEQRRFDKEKTDKERAERERAERERAVIERVAQEMAEREREERERAERKRIERERAENARAEREREEARLAQSRLEAERIKAAQDRLNQERVHVHPQSQALGSQPTVAFNPFRQPNPFSESPHPLYSSPYSPISAQPTPSGGLSPLHGLQNPTIPGLQLPGLHPTPGLHSTLPGLQYTHPGYYSPHGSHMSVGGDQNTYSNSVVNTNSGNTTNTVVTNSNNDSSVRTYQVGRRRK